MGYDQGALYTQIKAISFFLSTFVIFIVGYLYLYLTALNGG
jgi:hypothetical protein